MIMIGRTHFAHSISILGINVLDHSIDLTLELKLTAFEEIEAGSVDNREEDAVKARLADLDASGADNWSGFRGSA